MTRRTAERIEIVCQSCGVIAELHRPRTAPRPRFCDCPQPETVRTSTRPRYCMTCSTKLNRYNQGSECGACLHARHNGRPLSASARPIPGTARA